MPAIAPAKCWQYPAFVRVTKATSGEPPHTRRRLVVAESSRLPEPRLQCEDCLVRRLRSPRRRAARGRTSSVPEEARIRGIREEVAHETMPALDAERREESAVDLEESRGCRRIAGGRLRERARSRIRRVAPDAVALSLGDRLLGAQNAAGEQEHGAESVGLERDRRSSRREVVVYERLDLDALLEPPVGVAARACGISSGSWSLRAS